MQTITDTQLLNTIIILHNEEQVVDLLENSNVMELKDNLISKGFPLMGHFYFLGENLDSVFTRLEDEQGFTQNFTGEQVVLNFSHVRDYYLRNPIS